MRGRCVHVGGSLSIAFWRTRDGMRLAALGRSDRARRALAPVTQRASVVMQGVTYGV